MFARKFIKRSFFLKISGQLYVVVHGTHLSGKKIVLDNLDVLYNFMILWLSLLWSHTLRDHALPTARVSNVWYTSEAHAE